jgi:acyl-CoA reductase-like NAD-dependent aldehyde dehydrogenase
VRSISFTGSYAAGLAISRAAGLKRLTCELGSVGAMVVLEDADLDLAARAIAYSGFTNAGQNCVSTQRVVVDRRCRDELLERLVPRVAALAPGDPAAPATTLAPVIDAEEAARITGWLREAEDGGAVLACGGGRDGALVEPAVVVEPAAQARVWREELFGPAVVVRAVDGDDEALALANDTRYGLAASVVTSSVSRALRFAGALRAGMVNVNSPRGATWRADFMPWGGVGDSGFGREGVRFALREMTEDRLVVVHPEDAA